MARTSGASTSSRTSRASGRTPRPRIVKQITIINGDVYIFDHSATTSNVNSHNASNNHNNFSERSTFHYGEVRPSAASNPNASTVGSAYGTPSLGGDQTNMRQAFPSDGSGRADNPNATNAGTGPDLTDAQRIQGYTESSQMRYSDTTNTRFSYPSSNATSFRGHNTAASTTSPIETGVVVADCHPSASEALVPSSTVAGELPVSSTVPAGEYGSRQE